eukprot:6425042-Prorocentrum_lima.AAC.1
MSVSENILDGKPGSPYAVEEGEEGYRSPGCLGLWWDANHALLTPQSFLRSWEGWAQWLGRPALGRVVLGWAVPWAP